MVSHVSLMDVKLPVVCLHCCFASVPFPDCVAHCDVAHLLPMGCRARVSAGFGSPNKWSCTRRLRRSSVPRLRQSTTDIIRRLVPRYIIKYIFKNSICTHSSCKSTCQGGCETELSVRICVGMARAHEYIHNGSCKYGAWRRPVGVKNIRKDLCVHA